VYPGSRHVRYASTSDAAAAHTLTATPAWNAWNLPGLMCAEVILGNKPDGGSRKTGAVSRRTARAIQAWS